MTRVIPKEKLAGFQRWQIGSFDQPGVSAPSTATPATNPETSLPAAQPADSSAGTLEIPFPTADELARINEEARIEGYQAGHAEGFAAGEAKASAQSADQLAVLSALVGNLQVSLAHLDQEIAEQLLDLGLEVAAQIVRSSLSVNREMLLPTIREAIAELPFHHGTVTLHLNPDDAASLKDILKEQLAHIGAHIVADASLASGGCQIKAGSCEIDASIETRWRKTLEAIGAKPREWLNQT